MFIEKAYTLLRKDGFFGFVVPNNWLTLDKSYDLRKFLIDKTANLQVINLGNNIFDSASVDTCILSFKVSRNDNICFGEWNKESGLVVYQTKSKKLLTESNLYFQISQPHDQSVLQKITNRKIELKNIAIVKAGVQVYEIGKGNPKQTAKIKTERQYHSKTQHDKNWLMYLDGKNVSRYILSWSGEFVKYGKNLSRRRVESFFEQPRILVRQIPNKPPYCIHATYVENKIVNDLNSMIILQKDNGFDLKYVLGVLNSKLISYWFYYHFDKFQRKTFPQFKLSELDVFPIPNVIPDLQKPIIELANKAMELHNAYNTAGLTLKPILIDQISKTNKKIDEHVYDLFQLTKKEIQIVESDYYTKTV